MPLFFIMKMKKDKHGRRWWRCAVTQIRKGHIDVLAHNSEEAEEKIMWQNYGSAQEDWDWPNVRNEVHTTYLSSYNFIKEADN